MQNRIRYLLLFTMSLVFFLSAIPAVNAFEGISAGNFQMEENSPGAADLEIKTYQDIPYTGQFPASNIDTPTIARAGKKLWAKGSTKVPML